MTDWDLLQEWARTRSESAFAELLRRHLNLVYGSALRQVRDPEMARDVAQAVFLLLSRKAAEIKPKVVLSGWLFRATGYVASRASRAEVRRRRRESEAIIMNSDMRGGQIEGHSENGTVEQVEVDSALAELPEIDRNAVITRFIEGQSLRAVGERLGISEEAAKKRVTRALQKLRGLLAKRGTELTAAALGAMLLELRAEAAPVALENSIIQSALNDAFSSDVSHLAHEASAEMTTVSTSPFLAIAAGLVLFLGISIYCAGRFSSTPKTAQASVKQLRSVENIAGTELKETSPMSKAAVPGKSLLVIAVRSAEANQPLAAHAHVSTWTENDETSNQDLDADAQGIISIPVDGSKILSMSVWLSHPGRVPLQLGWEAHEFVVSILQQTVKMEQGRSLRGIVQNEEGKPIEGARITFQNPGSNLASRENLGFRDSTSAVETDAQGRFHSDQIPVPLGDTALSYVVDHPDYVRARVALEGLASLATNHIVVLHRGIRVHGRVVDNFGNPVAGATIAESHNYSWPHKQANGNGMGEFEIGPFAAGPVNISAVADGFEKTVQHVPEVRAATNLLLTLQPSSSATNDWDRAWRRREIVRIFGSVTDADSGQPVHDFTVQLNEHRGTSLRLIGDAHEGAFDWPVVMAFFQEFSLIIRAEGFAPGETDVRKVKKGGEERFDIKLKPGGDIAGSVVTSEGAPVSGAFVGLNGDGYGTLLLNGCHPHSGHDGKDTTTDANGHFHFPPQLGANSVVIVHDLGCVQVPIERLKEGPVVLVPWGAIEGRVTLGGKPVAGQGITLAGAVADEGQLPPINAQQNVTSDSDGVFLFPKVPAGPASVCRCYNFNPDKIGFIGLNDYHDVEVPAGGVAHVSLGGNGRTITGKLILSHPINGYDWRNDLQTLVEAGAKEPSFSGKPSGAAWRRHLIDSERFRRAHPRSYLQIAPDGSFRIDDVAPGAYNLTLAVRNPPDPTRPNDNFDRPQRGTLTRMITVSAGEEPMDLGEIVIPVNP